MRKQHLAFAGMWIAAIAAMLFLYFREEHGRAPSRTRPTQDALVIDVGEEHPAASTLEPTAAQAPIPEGPPLTYRGDRRHTGQSPYAGPARPGVFWQLDTHHPVVGQPAVDAEGNAFVGSRDHVFYSISRTGGVRWRRDLGSDIYASPALDGHGHVLIGSDADFFFSLDAATGDVLWDIHTDFDVDTGITIGPDGTIYFGSGEELWAVDDEGHTRWRFRARVKIFSAPAVADDGTIYFGAQDDWFYALSSDGHMLWRIRSDRPDDNDSSAIVADDGTIFFGSDDRRVYHVDRNGNVLWRAEVGGYVRAPMALGRRLDLIVPIFGPHARVASLDRATGEERWSFSAAPSQATDSGVGSGPIVDRDGNVYFGADDDYVYAVDPDGGLRWVFQAGANVDGDPIVTPDGALLIGSDDGNVYALRADAIAASPRTHDAGAPPPPAATSATEAPNPP
jgi:outer membrane protein assembly factor BamB